MPIHLCIACGFFYAIDRISSLQQKPYGTQSQKYLPFDSLQKFAKPYCRKLVYFLYGCAIQAISLDIFLGRNL